jgi:hypothetical protein
MVRRRVSAVSNHEATASSHPSRRGEDAAPQDEERDRKISRRSRRRTPTVPFSSQNIGRKDVYAAAFLIPNESSYVDAGTHVR